jgi:hypothetical protein
MGQLAVISTIDELLAQISRQVRTDPPSPLWFRGQRDAAWGVSPTLWRDAPSGPYTPADERNFTHRFRTRAAIRYSAAPAYDDHAGWLSLMQHYGLPTRLLDWSRSPLVAAFFAVEEALWRESLPPRDAAIWMLDPHALNHFHAGTPVTPALRSMMCEALVRPAFDERASSGSQRRARTVIAAMATESDLRMFVQQGCFTVHSRTASDLRHLGNSEAFLWQLRVPAGNVPQFAQDLRSLGFSRGDLFPDLDHLASDFRNEFPPGSIAAAKS